MMRLLFGFSACYRPASMSEACNVFHDPTSTHRVYTISWRWRQVIHRPAFFELTIIFAVSVEYFCGF